MMWFIVFLILTVLGVGLKLLYMYTDVGEWVWGVYNYLLIIGIGGIMLMSVIFVCTHYEHTYDEDRNTYAVLTEKVNLLKVSSEDYAAAVACIADDVHSWNQTVLREHELNESLWFDWFIPDEVIETTYNLIEIL